MLLHNNKKYQVSVIVFKGNSEIAQDIYSREEEARKHGIQAKFKKRDKKSKISVKSSKKPG